MIYTKEIKKNKNKIRLILSLWEINWTVALGKFYNLKVYHILNRILKILKFNSLFLLLHPTEEHKATYLRTLELRYKDRHTEA